MDLPGGGLEHNESIFFRAAQKAKKELDLTINEIDFKIVHLLHMKDEVYKGITIFVEANKWQGAPKIMETDKCEDFGWFEYKKLPENLATNFSLILKNLGQHNIFTSWGF